MIPILNEPVLPDTYTTLDKCHHSAYYVLTEQGVYHRMLLIQVNTQWAWLILATRQLSGRRYSTHKEALRVAIHNHPKRLFKIETKDELFKWLTTPTSP